MSQNLQRFQLTPQSNMDDVIEQVREDQTPRLSETVGEPPGVVSPVVPTTVARMQTFYEKMAKRPDVSELLSRLAKQ